MIAVHWPSKSKVRRYHPHNRQLVFVEVKHGDGALDGKSGLHDHVRDINKYAGDRNDLKGIKEDMVRVFNQKLELGLIDCGKPLVSFSDAPPILMLTFVNHDPEKSKLGELLQTLPESPNIELRIATASFFGYGLYDQGVHSLVEVWSRFGSERTASAQLYPSPGVTIGVMCVGCTNKACIKLCLQSNRIRETISSRAYSRCRSLRHSPRRAASFMVDTIGRIRNMPSVASLLPAVIDAVAETSTMLVEESRRPAGPRGAGDKAEIDVEIERYLADRLTTLLPARFVGEETPARPGDGSPFCWLVDPHDGTWAWLEGVRGSAVSVAPVAEKSASGRRAGSRRDLRANEPGSWPRPDCLGGGVAAPSA